MFLLLFWYNGIYHLVLFKCCYVYLKFTAVDRVVALIKLVNYNASVSKVKVGKYGTLLIQINYFQLMLLAS